MQEWTQSLKPSPVPIQKSVFLTIEWCHLLTMLLHTISILIEVISVRMYKGPCSCDKSNHRFFIYWFDASRAIFLLTQYKQVFAKINRFFFLIQKFSFKALNAICYHYDEAISTNTIITFEIMSTHSRHDRVLCQLFSRQCAHMS